MPEDSASELHNKLLAVLLRLERDFGPSQLEWSMDKEQIFIYQQTRSKMHVKDGLSFGLREVPEENIVIKEKQGGFGDVPGFGRLVWIRPLPKEERVLRLSEYYRNLSGEILAWLRDEFAAYIFICDRRHLTSYEEDDPQSIMGVYFREWLGTIRGWVDTSGIEVAVGAHYADTLVGENIPVISVCSIDEKRLKEFCPWRKKFDDVSQYCYEVWYSDDEFAMEVDPISEEGQVYLRRRVGSSR